MSPQNQPFIVCWNKAFLARQTKINLVLCEIVHCALCGVEVVRSKENTRRVLEHAALQNLPAPKTVCDDCGFQTMIEDEECLILPPLVKEQY